MRRKPSAAVVKGVSDLATELRLTPYQRRFCEVYVSDPQRSKTQAAIAAGSRPPTAAPYGTRLYKSPKIQRYIQALLDAAAKTVQGDVPSVQAAVTVAPEAMPSRPGAAVEAVVVSGRAPEAPIALAAEVLEILTAQARGQRPTRTQRRETLLEGTAPDGTVVALPAADVMATFDTLGAAGKLLEHHDGRNVPPPQRTVLTQADLTALIEASPPGPVRALVNALLARSSTTAELMAGLPAVERPDLRGAPSERDV